MAVYQALFPLVEALPLSSLVPPLIESLFYTSARLSSLQSAGAKA